MSYTIGLDFGTHQTKVCIEDSSNPAQKIYEFFEFNTPDGNKTVLLPSIIQINNDNTVSYGFVDESKCKIEEDGFPTEPILKQPNPPQYLPSPPKPTPSPCPERTVKKKTLKWLSFIEQLKYAFKAHQTEDSSDSEYEALCRDIAYKNKEALSLWESECEVVKNKNLEIKAKYVEQCNRIKAQYELDISNRKKEIKRRGLYFRYFKLASFYKADWERTIKPEILSAWYIANLIFLLEEKFGSEILVQMGVPSTMTTDSTDEAKNSLAIRIFIAARKLVEQYTTHESFLKAEYTELLASTKLPDTYSIEDKWLYGIETMPEAFAGLYAIIHQGRISDGMSLLVDIGGGTTDIAFFSKTENTPDIHHIVSYPRGMNFILEQLQDKQDLSISEIIRLFKKGSLPLKKAQDFYHEDLKKLTQKSIIEKVKCDFCRTSNFPIDALEQALVDRPIVYCGGGSTFNSMRKKIHSFTEVSVINKSLLAIPYLKNKGIPDELFTILSTSYGLSMPIQDDELKMTPLNKLFGHIQKNKNDHYTDTPDYGIDDY
ncbi:MAG: hypothetical protein MJZ87_02185 [Bacteroidales bacterium]|nr:hypothetical protein [Bacteroidales bacterium]